MLTACTYCFYKQTSKRRHRSNLRQQRQGKMLIKTALFLYLKKKDIRKIHWEVLQSALKKDACEARFFFENIENHIILHVSDGTMYVIWAASSGFGTYRLCEQRRFRRACASAQSRKNLRCSLIQAVSQEEPSDRKPDP